MLLLYYLSVLFLSLERTVITLILPYLPVTVEIIQRERGATFKGFIVQALDGETHHPIGQFVVGKGMQLLKECSAVTHTDAKLKKAVNLVWEAPYDRSGSVIFRSVCSLLLCIFFLVSFLSLFYQLRLFSFARQSNSISLRPALSFLFFSYFFSCVKNEATSATLSCMKREQSSSSSFSPSNSRMRNIFTSLHDSIVLAVVYCYFIYLNRFSHLTSWCLVKRCLHLLVSSSSYRYPHFSSSFLQLGEYFFILCLFSSHFTSSISTLTMFIEKHNAIDFVHLSSLGCLCFLRVTCYPFFILTGSQMNSLKVCLYSLLPIQFCDCCLHIFFLPLQLIQLSAIIHEARGESEVYVLLSHPNELSFSNSINRCLCCIFLLLLFSFLSISNCALLIFRSTSGPSINYDFFLVQSSIFLIFPSTQVDYCSKKRFIFR